MRSDKIKVLLCSPAPGRSGGISRWTEHIIKYYATLDCNIKMELFPLGRKGFVGYMSIIQRIYFGIIDYSKLILKYKRCIKKQEWDLVHLVSSASLSLFKDYILAFYAKRRGIKTIIHFRFGRIPELCEKRNWEYKLLRKVLSLIDIAIVLDKKSFQALNSMGIHNVELLPNPLSPTIEQTLINNKMRAIDVNKIVFVGEVLRTKGVFELLEACRRIKNIHIKLLGTIDDKMKKEILDFTHEDGIEWVEICGMRNYDTVLNEMSTAGVFVLPTYTEGFPNVILESMACACPIVTTPVGAIPEMLDINGTKPMGICVEPKNVDQLRIGISKMLKDRSFAIECGNNAKERVEKEYSMASVWDRMEKIWFSALYN